MCDPRPEHTPSEKVCVWSAWRAVPNQESIVLYTCGCVVSKSNLLWDCKKVVKRSYAMVRLAAPKYWRETVCEITVTDGGLAQSTLLHGHNRNDYQACKPSDTSKRPDGRLHSSKRAISLEREKRRVSTQIGHRLERAVFDCARPPERPTGLHGSTGQP